MSALISFCRLGLTFSFPISNFAAAALDETEEPFPVTASRINSGHYKENFLARSKQLVTKGEAMLIDVQYSVVLSSAFYITDINNFTKSVLKFHIYKIIFLVLYFRFSIF